MCYILDRYQKKKNILILMPVKPAAKEAFLELIYLLCFCLCCRNKIAVGLYSQFVLSKLLAQRN